MSVITIDLHSHIPLYVQLEQYLRELIQQEEYQKGKLLPSEVDMAAQFGVSRNTLRAAIDKLVQENLVIRKKGVGTVVNKHRIAAKLERWDGFSAEMDSKGIRMQTLFKDVKWVKADDDVAFDMGIKAGTPVCRLERLKGVDAEPVVLFISYFHPRVNVDADEFFDGRLYEVLERKYHAVPMISNEEIGALACNDYFSSKLAITDGAPVLFRKRFVLNAAEKLLEMCYSYYRSDKFVYSVQIKRS